MDHLLGPLREDLRRWEGLSGTVRLEDTDRVYNALPKYARMRYQIVGGELFASRARCVHRRDETTAWALLNMLERYPKQPDVDVVLNCRDGPLALRPAKQRKGLPDRETMARTPLVLSYSTTAQHQELAFPDYTLWGLPGKIKPWSQLRLDLLHRVLPPWEQRRPQMFASGIVNAYHSSIGVRTREKLQHCTDPRLALHYHRLYFERFYSTEEHCAYKYVLLSPGSHALWLDHMKQKMLCGSAVFLLEPVAAKPTERQYDVASRLLLPGVHYLSLPLTASMLRPSAPPTELCGIVAEALDWAEAHAPAVRRIAAAGRAIMRDAMTSEAIYGYMAEALAAASRLLAYPAAAAVGPSNASRVPTSPAAFRAWMRNDSDTYPVTAQMREADWAAVVMELNYSSMGVSFARDARALEAEVKRLIAERDAAEAERRRNATLARRARGGGRGRGGGAGRGGRRRAGRRQRSLDG